MTLVIDEEFGSHLVMIDSTFFIVSSITDSESMLGVEEEGVEGVEGVESEEEKESVVEDEKRRASIPLFAAILLGVSDRAIEPCECALKTNYIRNRRLAVVGYFS